MIDPVLLSEIRDFLQDISTGSPVTDASRDHATEFVALMDCPEDGQPQSPTGLYRGFEVRCPHCESWFEPEDFEEVVPDTRPDRKSEA